jgi:multidrug efflux pump subunit AcrA (membrane-fusion protein)
MAATANIIIETKSDVLTVPSGAVQGDGDQTYVVVVKDGREQNTPVAVGISSDTRTEIVSGVTEGDEVVTGTISQETQSRSTGTSPFGGFGGTRFMR